MAVNNKPMPNIKEFYILGRPIKTDIGVLYPVKVKDYPDFLEHIQILTFDKVIIIKWLQDLLKKQIPQETKKSIIDLLEYIKETPLFDLTLTLKGEQYGQLGLILDEVYKGYRKLFQFCFKEDVIDKIKNNDEFQSYIELIYSFNGMKYDKPSPNPRINQRNKIKQMIQQAQGENISLESIITSVSVSTKKDVNNMTLYELYKTFDRIGQFKNYERTVLYSIFSSDIKIDPWYKAIEHKDEQSFITEQQLQKAREQKGLHEKM